MKRLMTFLLPLMLTASVWAEGMGGLQDLWQHYDGWISILLTLLLTLLASATVALKRQNRRMRQDNIALQAAKEATQASELFGKATFDAVSAQMCVLDHAGIILTVNQAWRDFLDANRPKPEPGCANGDYGVGTNYLNICDCSIGPQSDEALSMANGVRSVMSGACELFVLEYPCHSPTEQRWFNAKVTRFPGNSGNVVVAHESITAVKLTETRLQLAAIVFTHAREGIVITDVNGTILEVNDTFTRTTGYSRAEVLGKNPRILKSGRQSPAFYKAMWAALIGNGFWQGEVWNRRKDGTEYAGLITISAALGADGKAQHFAALFTDITALKEHAKQLERIAHYDVLTGLPNRVLLADRLEQGIILSQRQNLSMAVVALDLDGFKAVNDLHGHNTGDELLITLAQRMRAALRDGDTLARVGGDEFVAVLIDLERPQDCEPVLNRMLQAIAVPIQVGSTEVSVSASMGVTLYPQDGADADLLLRHADQAMYVAKEAGKNCYHLFDLAQDTAVKTQRESLDRIRLGMDGHEFVLYYQPKVNMRTGRVIGAEALIRWQHPERGLLAPAAFLPVIEGLAISVVLGEWVIGTALAQMAQWLSSGLTLGVSVNISAHQLQQANFAARLGDLLATYPTVQPHHLELEVLETSALQDMAQVSKMMHACRSLGVHFALDDFGTGYSSLTYLKHLPADVLKIDQSFVRGMLSDPNDLAIVKGVIGLTAAFNREVIAEGVETAAHGAMLLPLGCELAQGYGIARPMPAQNLPQWVASWQANAAWTA